MNEPIRSDALPLAESLPQAIAALKASQRLQAERIAQMERHHDAIRTTIEQTIAAEGERRRAYLKECVDQAFEILETKFTAEFRRLQEKIEEIAGRSLPTPKTH